MNSQKSKISQANNIHKNIKQVVDSKCELPFYENKIIQLSKTFNYLA